MYKNERKTTREKDVMLSKKLSWLLRHGTTKEHIRIQSTGFIKVEDILKHPNHARDFDIDILRRIVDNDAKKRYTLRMNPEGGFLEIRANQGHTLKEVTSEQCLKTIDHIEEVPLAVHGTYYRHWPSIQRTGLKRMSRNHIHFATSDAQADNISGFRGDSQLLIYLDVKKIFEDGTLKLYRSENNVILCSGRSEDGVIPCYFFQKVVDRKSGKTIDF